MNSQIDSPKALPLADFRRGAGDFHSVTKQTPFRIVFRVNLGGQNRSQIHEISSFGAVCFASSFQAANLMVSGGSPGWKTLILLRKNKGFSWNPLSCNWGVFRSIFDPKFGLKSIRLGCCFFDFIFEANFIDFGVPFGGRKTIKFRKNYDFWTTLVGTLLWKCHWLRIWSNFEVTGGQISWILVPEECEIWEFPGEWP